MKITGSQLTTDDRFCGWLCTYLLWVYIVLMELLQIAKLPIDAMRFAGRQLLGGAWADLPKLPQPDFEAPARASIQHYRTPDLPENVELGQE